MVFSSAGLDVRAALRPRPAGREPERAGEARAAVRARPEVVQVDDARHRHRHRARPEGGGEQRRGGAAGLVVVHQQVEALEAHQRLQDLGPGVRAEQAERRVAPAAQRQVPEDALGEAGDRRAAGALPAEQRLPAGQAQVLRSGVVPERPSDQPERLAGPDLGHDDPTGHRLGAVAAEQPDPERRADR
jgi:hypothetical protein